MATYLCTCKFLSTFFSADGNEYASVDDPAILKMNSERDHCKINKKDYYYHNFRNVHFTTSTSNFVLLRKLNHRIALQKNSNNYILILVIMHIDRYVSSQILILF